MAYTGSSGGIENYMKGLKEFNVSINKEIEKLKYNGLCGLIRSAALLRHETEHSYPATPRKLGNLVASWFVVTAKSIHAGKTPTFKGPDVGQFQIDHSDALAEKRAEATANSSAERKMLIMGYSANYAGYIHESLIARKFTPRKPRANIKWFEYHFKANKDKILQIIAKEVKIP